MARKVAPTVKPDDPEQYRRFLDMAKEVGADESPGALDKVFDRLKPAIIKPRPGEKTALTFFLQ
jgi:hypothetical protein